MSQYLKLVRSKLNFIDFMLKIISKGNPLLKEYTAHNISFEDLPVDDTMRNFFENPKKYIGT